MSMIRIVADYDNEDIESLAVTEAALLSQVFDIKSRKETLINKAVKESREEKTVKVKEEPEPEVEEEPKEKEENMDALDAALTAFHQTAWQLRDKLEKLPRRTRIDYELVENAIDEMLLASNWDYEVEPEPEPELEPKEETSELGEAVAAFRRAAGEFRDTLDNLVTLSGVKDKLESYDEVMNVLDEILQKSTDFEEEKK